MVATRRTPAKKKASSRSPSPAPRKKTPAKKSVSSRSPSPAPRKKTPCVCSRLHPWGSPRAYTLLTTTALDGSQGQAQIHRQESTVRSWEGACWAARRNTLGEGEVRSHPSRPAAQAKTFPRQHCVGFHRTWYGGTISKYNTRAGTHTIDYDDGETYIHDLRKTQYKASKVEEAGHLANTSAPDDAGTATDAELVTALLPQDGDCVSIKWAGAPDCICILRKDKAGCVNLCQSHCRDEE